jgi:hypothetical protein
MRCSFVPFYSKALTVWCIITVLPTLRGPINTTARRISISSTSGKNKLKYSCLRNLSYLQPIFRLNKRQSPVGFGKADAETFQFLVQCSIMRTRKLESKLFAEAVPDQKCFTNPSTTINSKQFRFPRVFNFLYYFFFFSPANYFFYNLF